MHKRLIMPEIRVPLTGPLHRVFLNEKIATTYPEEIFRQGMLVFGHTRIVHRWYQNTGQLERYPLNFAARIFLDKMPASVVACSLFRLHQVIGFEASGKGTTYTGAVIKAAAETA